MSDPRPTQRPWTADEKKKLADLLEAGKTGVAGIENGQALSPAS
jgi:hypothetical protein